MQPSGRPCCSNGSAIDRYQWTKLVQVLAEGKVAVLGSQRDGDAAPTTTCSKRVAENSDVSCSWWRLASENPDGRVVCPDWSPERRNTQLQGHLLELDGKGWNRFAQPQAP